MGRSKSVPIQKRPNEVRDDTTTTTTTVDDEAKQQHVPLLGRRIFIENTTFEQQQQLVIEEIDDDDDDSRIDTNRNDNDNHDTPPNNKRQRQQRIPSERTSPALLSASSYPSTLTSLVQRIEKEEQEKKLQRRDKQQQRRRRHGATGAANRKVVQFANGAPITIPPLEISFMDAGTLGRTITNQLYPDSSTIPYDICHETTILESDEPVASKILMIMPKAVPDQKDPETNSYWLLSEHILPHTLLVHQMPPNGSYYGSSDTTKTTIFPITTKQGAMDVWTYAQQHSNHPINRHQWQIAALGRSVEAGVVRLQLLQDPVDGSGNTAQEATLQHQVRLQIALSLDAITDLCHKDQMKPSLFDKICRCTNGSIHTPSILKENDDKTRRRKGHRPSSLKPKLSTIQQHQIYDLFLALALIFPDTEVADVFLVDGGCGTTNTGRSCDSNESKLMVTAQQVYALTDNVQLHHAYHDHDDSNRLGTDLSIPGLLPTLRSYQCKAVEWMLRREQPSPTYEYSNNSDEWELAWIVLSSEIISNNDIRQTTQHDNPRHRQPELLSTWKRKHRFEQDNDIQNVLLFCPFTGWMTNSVSQAKEWTIGPPSNTISVSGGILAESMGLGKTVEVLACILANPRNQPMTPSENCDTVVASAPNIHPVAKRQLNFNDCADSPVTNSTSDNQGASQRMTSKNAAVAIVDDMNEFCDAEIDSDIDSDSQALVLPVQTLTDVFETTNAKATTTEPISVAATVTPMKIAPACCVEERWTENDILGACICGNLIGFDTQNRQGAIVICQSCDEPMHMNCAAFDSVEVMNANTCPMQYQHTISHSTLNCRLCKREQCPCCVGNITSGATLIVTPPAILNQWEREIFRHARNAESNLPLQVVIYDGIKRLTQSHSAKKNSQTIKYMHPRHLASADVVLITFEALMNDLGHTDDNQFVSRGSEDEQSSALRKRKRYRVVPSPLLSIKWWRVCLDEAQRVETPTAGSAQMALKLDAVHRWCISGTPIQRGNLNDLYGLLLFLRLDPFWDKGWFLKCFNPANRHTHDRIKHLLHNVFWRSTKASKLVRDQMGIPEQIEKKIMLNFSSIEKHFYDRQLEQTIIAANDVSNLSGQTSKKRSSRILLLSDQLHKLRAACCHPQVGSSGITSTKQQLSKNGDNSVSSRVMTMSQILDKFIDDAKIQCEESQRIVVLHTNGMAAVSKLKIEAKYRGINIAESDNELLEKCCQLYNQSLRLADENSVPTIVLGEVELTGSSGFRIPGKILDKYNFSLEWQRLGTDISHSSIWTKLEVPFGSSRKLTQVRARSYRTVPINLIDDSSTNFEWRLLFPKDCTFQCMESTGEFVNVYTFTVPYPDSDNKNEWVVANGFRTNKSKAWRLVVDTVYPLHTPNATKEYDCNNFGTFIGIEFECYEATIANDPLQRLHCLHNASQAYNSLLQLKRGFSVVEDSEQGINVDDASEKVCTMTTEARKIESLYLNGVRAHHKEFQRRLEESAATRIKLENELRLMNRNALSQASIKDCWDDCWWDDFLVLCHLYGTEAQQTAICNKVRQDLDGMLKERLGTTNQNEIIAFPMFGDIAGLRTALQLRVRDIRAGLGSKPTRRHHQLLSLGQTDHKAPLIQRFRCTEGGHGLCMQSILDLTEFPPEEEIYENSRCHECKADWLQTGPKCRHCKIGDTLAELLPDKVTVQLLNSVHSIVKGSIGSALLQSFGNASLIVNRAKIFHDVLDACKKERSVAFRLWRTHLNLLNDIDELNQCKSTMRLRNENEDVTEISKEQLNAILEPVDVNTAFHQYAAKQAMALGALSRAKGTLQYLKNLSVSERQAMSEGTTKDDDGQQTCLICLSKFDTDRAILRCGHGFHLSPCLDRLRARGGNLISCPLRCTTRTKFDEVMIAAANGKRHDDGSHIQRHIKGSYGTKVTRLVSDVLDVCDMGEKGIVFSQWEDMLDICEHALTQNGVKFTRATSLRQIGACTQRFREPDCSVMLLNVKHGAEGLTLVEATHVFMVEPLLNCGLDIQAINRIHRIGQNRKTYVWRYIVADTVEVKIDQLRMKHQEDQIDEDESMMRGGGNGNGTMKKSTVLIQAGGIDGGFQSQAEVFELLQS